MTTHAKNNLSVFAALLALGLTARGQYVWTTLKEPLAGAQPNGPDTLAANISGTNIVGGYGYFSKTNGVLHGFLLSGTSWTTLDHPLAGSGPAQGTYAAGVLGTNVAGWYVDSSGVTHGFLYNGSTWITLDDPQADLSPSGGTDAFGIDGTNISGYYLDASGVNHGFLYNLATRTWTTLDDPLAGNGSGQGTDAEHISGGNVVGLYYDASSVGHGFVYNILTKAWTTLDDPLAGSGYYQGTIAFSISGTNIVGGYNSGKNWHGFLYNGRTWTTLDDPLVAEPGASTLALGVDGASIVGICIHTNGVYQGGFSRPQHRSWLSPAQPAH